MFIQPVDDVSATPVMATSTGIEHGVENTTPVSPTKNAPSMPFLVVLMFAPHVLPKKLRIIVGTLVKVGQGKIPPEQVGEMIEKKERALGGKTMPPQGLYLKSVRYPEKYGKI